MPYLRLVFLSDKFCVDAVGYYKDVNSYTDSQKIKDQTEEALFHSTFVKVYLCFVTALFVAISIMIVAKYFLKKILDKTMS